VTNMCYLVMLALVYLCFSSVTLLFSITPILGVLSENNEVMLLKS
jgi:hypothetical protein